MSDGSELASESVVDWSNRFVIGRVVGVSVVSVIGDVTGSETTSVLVVTSDGLVFTECKTGLSIGLVVSGFVVDTVVSGFVDDTVVG